MDDTRQLPSLFVLPVVVEELGEDGEVEDGEDETYSLQCDLSDLLAVRGRAELALVYAGHLPVQIKSQSLNINGRFKVCFFCFFLRLNPSDGSDLPSVQLTCQVRSLSYIAERQHQSAWREGSE